MVDNKPHAARSLPLPTTFSTPLGIMMCTALAAHWSFHNSLIRGGIGSYDGFLSVWIKFVALLTVWEPISWYSDVFWQFHKSLSHLLTQGSLITTKICFEPSEHEREERARKRSIKMERKHELAALAREEIASLQQQGHVIVYTDGSAEWVQQVGWVGGYGCSEPTEKWEHCSYPPPPHLRQSINRAELQAVIDVVHHYRHRTLSVAVATDSAYVHDGLQGKAMQWKAASWVTARGPVINVDLWEEILDKLLHSTCKFRWVKVPSHVDIAENEQADRLAERGKKLSPLYNTVHRAVRQPVTPPCSPPALRICADASAGPHMRVEITPLLQPDDVTPLIARMNRTHTHPEDPVRQLFPDDPGTDSEGLASSDQDSQSGCSTIESPRHNIVDDYLSDGNSSDRPLSSDNEFSTDVSSTRKRRK